MTEPSFEELIERKRDGHEHTPAEIDRILDRADALGHMNLGRPLEFVLCHCDCHTANLLIDSEGRLFIVDWDQPLLAPVEGEHPQAAPGPVFTGANHG